MASIRPATSADLSAVLTLLKDSGLPWQDLTAAHLDGFLLAVDGESVLGTVGLERYGRDALLRSLAVAPVHRGGGVGTQLADAIEQHARRTGTASLHLLTTTATEFFARRGYRPIARAEAPAALQVSTEFSALCPSQAVCMRRNLN